MNLPGPVKHGLQVYSTLYFENVFCYHIPYSRQMHSVHLLALFFKVEL